MLVPGEVLCQISNSECSLCYVGICCKYSRKLYKVPRNLICPAMLSVIISLIILKCDTSQSNYISLLSELSSDLTMDILESFVIYEQLLFYSVAFTKMSRRGPTKDSWSLTLLPNYWVSILGWVCHNWRGLHQTCGPVQTPRPQSQIARRSSRRQSRLLPHDVPDQDLTLYLNMQPSPLSFLHSAIGLER